MAQRGRGPAGCGSTGGVAPRGVVLHGAWLRRGVAPSGAWLCRGRGSARLTVGPRRGDQGLSPSPPSVLPLLSCQSSLLGPGGKHAQPLGLGFPDWAASPLPAGRVRLLWAKAEVLKFRSWAPGTGCAPVASGWTPRIPKCPQPRRPPPPHYLPPVLTPPSVSRDSGLVAKAPRGWEAEPRLWRLTFSS